MNRHQKYYGRNREQRKQQVKNRLSRIQFEVREYKFAKGCARCGYNRCARSLEFHHTNAEDKEAVVSRLLGQGASLKKLTIEIEKCVLLCANCHGEVHANEKEFNSAEASSNGKEIGPSPRELGFDSPRLYQNPNVPQPKTKKPTIFKFCPKCGKQIRLLSEYCISCNVAPKRQPTKIDWPSKEELVQRVSETNYSALARELGVSVAAIKKRVNRH